jgi:hypothetical protein
MTYIIGTEQPIHCRKKPGRIFFVCGMRFDSDDIPVF